MSKKTFKLVCANISMNQRGSVTLAEDIKPIAAAPGQPAGLTAKNVIQLNFTDPKKAAEFEIGKQYTVTIE